MPSVATTNTTTMSSNTNNATTAVAVTAAGDSKDLSKSNPSSGRSAEASSSHTSMNQQGQESPMLEAFKQAITLMEHKIRNLEKRKVKLDQYKSEQEKGRELNADQLAAVSKYTEVMNQLDFAKDIMKNLEKFNLDTVRQLRKQAKRDLLEREKNDIERYKFVLLSLRILQDLQMPQVKDDLLTGSNGAIKLKKEDLVALDELYSKIHLPSNDSSLNVKVGTAAESFLLLLDEKNKSLGGKTFKELKSLLNSLAKCDYFSTGKLPAVKEIAQKVESSSKEIKPAKETKAPKVLDNNSRHQKPAAIAKNHASPSPVSIGESLKAQNFHTKGIVFFTQDSTNDNESHDNIIDPAIVAFVPPHMPKQQEISTNNNNNAAAPTAPADVDNSLGNMGNNARTDIFHQASDNQMRENFNTYDFRNSRRPQQQQQQQPQQDNTWAAPMAPDNNNFCENQNGNGNIDMYEDNSKGNNNYGNFGNSRGSRSRGGGPGQSSNFTRYRGGRGGSGFTNNANGRGGAYLQQQQNGSGNGTAGSAYRHDISGNGTAEYKSRGRGGGGGFRGPRGRGGSERPNNNRVKDDGPKPNQQAGLSTQNDY